MLSPRQSDQPLPVAQYLRMSTDHQRYSTANQRDAIARYVLAHGMEVVETYEDSGKSGLTLSDRPGLQQLLADVCSANNRFRAIIVFDVSRWGRFQDVDESAHYEFLCRRSGVQVVYVAEPFDDVKGPMAVVIKSVKRAMAAEFSRELGNKVLAGQQRLAKHGFKMGGRSPFGLRRLLVAEDGKVKGELQDRERKSIATDRVVFAPGDPLEVFVVRHIFNLYTGSAIRPADIARSLNWAGWPARDDVSSWSTEAVKRVLRNEYYVGTLVFNRQTCRLRTPRRFNSIDQWVRASDSFEGLVSHEQFDRANALLDSRRPHRWTSEEMLDIVRRVHAKHGRVSPSLIQAEEGKRPSISLYIGHFGSVADACDAAGVPASDRLVSHRERIARRHRVKVRLLEELANQYRLRGTGFYWSLDSRRALVEGGFVVSVKPTQPLFRSCAPLHWVIFGERAGLSDAVVAARLEPHGDRVLDYFVLPSGERNRFHVDCLGRSMSIRLERFRVPDLNGVVQRLERIRLISANPEAHLPGALVQRRRMQLGIRRRDDPHYVAHRHPG